MGSTECVVLKCGSVSHFEAEFVPLLARNYEGGGKTVKL